MARIANPDLTDQELETLRWYAAGLRTMEIAHHDLNEKRSVEWQVEQIKKKLSAKTLPNAVYVAMRKGLIT